MALLMRFRAVARRQYFLEIASPSLATPASLHRQSTVNNLSRLRLACSNTRSKAAALSSRFVSLNRLLSLFVNPGVLLVVVTVAGDFTASTARGPLRGAA